MKIVIAILLVLLTGYLLWRYTNIGSRVFSGIAPCSEEIDFAVYHKLQETLHGYNSVNAWIDKPSKEALDKEQDEINRIRLWMKTAQLEPCVRSEYNGWLDFYFQLGLNEAYREHRTQAEAQRTEKYRRETDELFERVKRLEQEKPIPGPPKR